MCVCDPNLSGFSDGVLRVLLNPPSAAATAGVIVSMKKAVSLNKEGK